MSRYRDELNRQVDAQMAHMKDHVLTREDKGHWRMGKPNSGMFSTHLIFMAGRIGITGDFSPGLNGVWSDLSYDIRWFASKLSWDYLAQKFLKREWQPEVAVMEAKDHLESGNKDYPEHDDFYRAVIREIEEDKELGSIYPIMNEYQMESDYTPGIAYPLNDTIALVAIQRKFAELYAARVEEVA